MSAAEAGLTPRKRAAFSAITALLTVGVCAGSWAGYRRFVAARSYRPQPYTAMFLKREPPLNYTLIPGWQGIDHEVEVRANSEGVRDDEWPPAPADAFRILALGDSQTFGVSVAREQAWPQRLQSAIAEAGGRASVRTAAVPGWNFADEAAFLRAHFERLRPDVVVVLVIPNDLDDAITAGPFHQLTAVKPPFAPYYTMTDAWVMQSFALARAHDPALEFTIANAFRESWRRPFFPSYFLENRSESGHALYARYEQELTGLVRFLRANHSELVAIVDSRRDAGGFEANVGQIYDRAGVRHVEMSRWAGDYDHYYRRWSNLPRDNHAGPAYHALIADVALGEIARLGPAQSAGLRAPRRPLPAPAPEWTLAGLRSRLARGRGVRFDALDSRVSWSHPDTLRQLLCLGGDYSESRYVLVSPQASRHVRVRMAAPAAGGTPAAWVDAGQFRGFAPSAVVDGSLVLELPQPMPAGVPVEIGLVAGAVADGVFTETFPVQEIALEPPPAAAVAPAPDPILVRGRIIGLTGDGWMARELTLPLGMAALERRTGGVLEVGIESLGPASVHPMTLGAAAGTVPLGTFTVEGPGPATWSIPLDTSAVAAAEGRLTLRSDHVFVPARVDAANPDQRELSVRIVRLRFR
jgi:lysophospholipase L1-like esterase